MKFIISHFTKSLHKFESLKVSSFARMEEVLGRKKFHNSTDDQLQLANEDFAFFKMQMDPAVYQYIRQHRSRFGEDHIDIPLEDTGVLSRGCLYILDIGSRIYIQKSGQMLPEINSALDELDYYRFFFYGKDILQGLALALLFAAITRDNIDPIHELIRTNFITLAHSRHLQEYLDNLLVEVLNLQILSPHQVSFPFCARRRTP